jgi:hypothetical protein
MKRSLIFTLSTILIISTGCAFGYRDISNIAAETYVNSPTAVIVSTKEPTPTPTSYYDIIFWHTENYDHMLDFWENSVCAPSLHNLYGGNNGEAFQKFSHDFMAQNSQVEDINEIGVFQARMKLPYGTISSEIESFDTFMFDCYNKKK